MMVNALITMNVPGPVVPLGNMVAGALAHGIPIGAFVDQIGQGCCAACGVVCREEHARNAVFYGEKAIDRSPCGTGTSGRMAHWVAKGRLKVGDAFVHESIIGSLFNGRVEAETTVGDKLAIIPSVAGWARVTGLNTILIDDRDPFAHGFSVV